jgi:hypothetical protein
MFDNSTRLDDLEPVDIAQAHQMVRLQRLHWNIDAYDESLSKRAFLFYNRFASRFDSISLLT